MFSRQGVARIIEPVHNPKAEDQPSVLPVAQGNK